MSNKETLKQLITVDTVQEIKFSKKNFEELKRLFVEKQQEINTIYGIFEQNTSLMNDVKNLKKDLSVKEQKVDYYHDLISVLAVKIKSLKLNVKFYKKRLKLNEKD
jgi:hypothetical protein